MDRIRKILLTLLSALFIFTFTVNAQNYQRKDSFEAEKTAFFNQEMGLTQDERELFWPVYNDYSNRNNKINIDRKSLYQYVSKNKDYMSEQELQDALSKFLSYQKQETALLENYNKKFLEILPPKKVMMIYVTENRFKVHVLKMIKDNRQIPERDF